MPASGRDAARGTEGRQAVGWVDCRNRRVHTGVTYVDV